MSSLGLPGTALKAANTAGKHQKPQQFRFTWVLCYIQSSSSSHTAHFKGLTLLSSSKRDALISSLPLERVQPEQELARAVF